jgi:serine/threonine-protein kinase
MQYVAGESLQARVAREGPLGISEMLRIAIQAAAGLAAAHEQGLVHRDIKPANLLLEAGVERALLTDFGLARAIDDASLTHTGILAGTPDYMSPEQADGRTVDHRSDLFSLGAVLYFMATGHPPFRAQRPMAVLNRICHSRHRPVGEINPDVPPPLAWMIDRLLEKKPSRRPGSAVEVQQALARLLSDVQLGRVRGAQRWQSSVRRWFPAVAAVSCSLMVVALLWIFAWLRQPGPSTPTVRTGPSVPIPVPAAGPRDAHGITELFTIGPATELEHAAEATAIRRKLDRLEARTPVSGAFIQRVSPSEVDELKAVRSAISQMENSSYPELVPAGDTQ